MEANFLQIPLLYSKSSSSSSPIYSLTRPRLQIFIRSPPHRLRSLTVTPVNSSSSNDAPPPVPPPPPETVEIRFRRGSRKRRQTQLQDGGGEANRGAEGSSSSPPPPPTKNWEEMSIREKAIELYVGEKGMLFWLNKLAYASIFIVIGAWILFRFVGPALNLYQLESAAPLSPSSLFKGS